MSRPKPSSRANGRHSHGPATQAGKDRSRLNSLKHGLAAQTITVLENESQEDFDSLLQSFNDHFQPMDRVEADLVKDMVDARWGLLRLHLIETTQMNELMRQNSTGNPELDMTRAFAQFADSGVLALKMRYESQLHMKMQRASRSLSQLRKEFPVQLEFELPDEMLQTESVSEAETVNAAAPADPQPESVNPATQEVPTAPQRWTKVAA